MRFITVFLGVFFFSGLPLVHALQIEAPQAYMVDLQTGTVLFDKNATQKMAPSSMSKIMTAYLVFERLKSGDVKLTDTLPVSKEAWQTGGTKMFVNVGSSVSIEDLLKGVIVQSGNDACVVLAEGLSGTEAAFAEEATRKAHEMGATNTTFRNATGLPAEEHLTTAKDLALIAEKTIHDFPEFYAQYYGLKEFTYNKITQANRNTLLSKNIGADGMKTGHTDIGGYGIIASAKQGDRRIIMVINGLPSSQARDKEGTALLNWGFNYFKNYKIFGKDAVVDVVDVWGGAEKHVPLVAKQDIILTLPRSQRKDLKVKLVYESPLAAPLKAGDKVGVIEITTPTHGVKQFPLYVGKDVKRAWFPTRIKNSVTYLLFGKY